MGNAISEEAKFLSDIKKQLKNRNIEVRKKDLLQFLLFVHKVCPWFVITCPKIVPSTWDQIGRKLADYFDQHGNDSDKDIMLQYWQLLKNIIVGVPRCPLSSQIIQNAQEHLELASRHCLRSQSRAISFVDLADHASPLSDPLPPLTGSATQTTPPSPPSLARRVRSFVSALYPSLRAVPSAPTSDAILHPPPQTAILDPIDTAYLEREATDYHHRDTNLTQTPPPYNPSDLPAPFSTANPHPLQPEIHHLREILQLERQIAQLRAGRSSAQFMFPFFDEPEQSAPIRTPTRPRTRA